MQNENTKERRKDDLHIVKDRYFLCRGVCIRCCNGKLSARCCNPCQHQTQKLLHAHRFIGKKQIRCCHQHGKQRKSKYNDRSLYTMTAQYPYHRIGNPCSTPSRPISAGIVTMESKPGRRINKAPINASRTQTA